LTNLLPLTGEEYNKFKKDKESNIFTTYNLQALIYIMNCYKENEISFHYWMNPREPCMTRALFCRAMSSVLFFVHYVTKLLSSSQFQEDIRDNQAHFLLSQKLSSLQC
jgi:hypothetical protein